MTKLITEDIQKLKGLIEEAQNIVLFTHTSPDGDALGANGAWLEVLRTLYPEKSIWIVSPDLVERYLSWLPLDNNFVTFWGQSEKALKLIAEADLFIHLDHNQVKRIRYPELIEGVYNNSKAKRILIDHHEYPDAGFDLYFSYPELSSTSELSFILLKELGWTKPEIFTPKCATFLLTGIVTDTGRLMYACFYPEIFKNFSELIALGANYPHIIDQLSYHGSEAQLRLQGYMLNNKLELHHELGTAILTLTQEEIQRMKVTKGDTEGIVNLPLTIEGINSCCFIREDKSQIKLSMRSIGDIPVNLIAINGFRGGGHLNAAGAEHQGTIEEAKEIFLRKLAELKK